jgi:hypothetical protein
MPMSLEQCLVACMRAELGNGEQGGNNDGPCVWRYRRWVDDDQPWCAALVSYCYEEAAGMVGRPLPKGLRRTHSAKQLGERVKIAGQELRVPELGCVVVWHRGLPTASTGHIGICESYDPTTDTLISIEGNKGKAPSPVQRYRYVGKAWREDLYLIATTRKPQGRT